MADTYVSALFSNLHREGAPHVGEKVPVIAGGSPPETPIPETRQADAAGRLEVGREAGDNLDKTDSADTLPNGTVVFTAGQHHIGTDALLLAEFCELRPGWAVCDLGAGCGILLLALVDRGLTGPAVAVERDAEGARLVQRAAAAGGLAQLTVVRQDLRTFRSGRPFDLVVANPPYYSAGPASPNAQRAAARHETGAGDLDEWCAATARLLKDRGRFCLCYPPERLAELMDTLRTHKLEPKRLQFVRAAATEPPSLVLIEARKACGVGLRILPDLLII